MVNLFSCTGILPPHLVEPLLLPCVCVVGNGVRIRVEDGGRVLWRQEVTLLKLVQNVKSPSSLGFSSGWIWNMSLNSNFLICHRMDQKCTSSGFGRAFAHPRRLALPIPVTKVGLWSHALGRPFLHGVKLQGLRELRVVVVVVLLLVLLMWCKLVSRWSDDTFC